MRLSATQHANVIETMIKNGTLKPEVAEKLRAKEDKRKARTLLFKAKQGNTKAMETAAKHYMHGTNGMEKDDQEAYRWYCRAQVRGSVLGTAMMGYMLANGVGVSKNEEKGKMYLNKAAGMGSDWAAYILGLAFADGKGGFAVNRKEAVRWLEMSISMDSDHQNMSDDCLEDALRRLHEMRISDDSEANSRSARSATLTVRFA